MDLFLEAGNQFAVGGDQRLLCFDLGDDGLLDSNILRNRNWNAIQRLLVKLRLCCASNELLNGNGIEVSSVRLKVEQHQLVVGGGWNSLVSVGLEGACYLGLLENRHR